VDGILPKGYTPDVKPTAQKPFSRAAVWLLPLLLVAAVFYPETRVWGSTVAGGFGLRAPNDVTRLMHPGYALGYDEHASESLVAPNTLAPEIRALSEANITGNGRTVLGHYPGYIEKAQRTGASYFDIGDAWNTLTPVQRSAANMHFLDEVAGAGDQIYLSVPKTKIRPGSSLADEVQYLTGDKGYQWINQWSLRPPGN